MVTNLAVAVGRHRDHIDFVAECHVERRYGVSLLATGRSGSHANNSARVRSARVKSNESKFDLTRSQSGCGNGRRG